MFGSQVLDTIIGLITVFLVLALGASSATEAVSRLLSKRAKDLEAGIKAMLAGSKADKKDQEAVFRVFEGTTVYDSAKAAAGKTLFLRRWKKPSYLSAKSFADAMEALKKQSVDPTSEIAKLLDDTEVGEVVRARVREVIGSASTVALDPMVNAAASAVTHAGDTLTNAENAVKTAEGELEQAEASVRDADEPAARAAAETNRDDARAALEGAMTALVAPTRALEDAKKTLEDAWADASATAAIWKAELESWFDSTMDRVSGTYKRFTTLWLFAFGLVFAVGANASAFHVAEELWTDPITADAVADAVSNVITEDTSEETAATTTTTLPEDDSSDTTATTVPANDPNNPFDNDIESIAEATAQLEELQIPIGWSADDRAHWRDNWRPEDWTSHMLALVLGWIVTALLVMQGAPFWFDLLTKAVSLRNAGGKPSLAIKDDTSATTQALKNQADGRGGSTSSG